MIKIDNSVGRSGINRSEDVMTIQRALNLVASRQGIEPLTVNGQADSRLFGAIDAFQKRFVDATSQDGRIDPRGRTIRALEDEASSEASGGVTTPPVVTYASDIPDDLRVVSGTGIAIVQKALTQAKMRAAVITSTMRPASEQASIMYRMASANLAKQIALYGATGDQVLKVFSNNKAKPKDQVITLMEKKIVELQGKGMLVSRHVVSPAQYAKLNVFDIGVNSTTRAAGSSFTPTSKAALTKAFAKLEAQGVISKFIDETMKDNNCWHLEVIPKANTAP